MINNKDRKIIIDLAKEWIELASKPSMEEKKALWKSSNDLKPKRPMILVESNLIEGFIPENDLLCEDDSLRNVERTMRWILRHYKEVGDDLVIEPYFRLAWIFLESDYGVVIKRCHKEDIHGGKLGHSYNFPLKKPADVKKLKVRTRCVNKKKTLDFKYQLEDIMGDILPVRLSNCDYTNDSLGYSPWVGNNFIGITVDIFQLIGNENLLFWLYDNPEEIIKISKHIMDDRIKRFKWLEKEGYLGCNTDNQFAGPLSY